MLEYTDPVPLYLRTLTAHSSRECLVLESLVAEVAQVLDATLQRRRPTRINLRHNYEKRALTEKDKRYTKRGKIG